jgi:hypothetical protein
MPKEFDLFGVYLPPMLVVVALAVAAAVATAHLLNRLRMTRFIAAPPLFLIAMVAIYAVLFSTFIILA